MAELVVSMVVGPLLSMVKDKASSYLLDQYKVMEGMEEQHKILKRKLPAILDVIADAEEQATHRDGAKTWLEEIKTVAYAANDVFDEFSYEALRRAAKRDGHISKLGMINAVKLFPTHNRVAFRNRMSNKLRTIVETIEVLVAEMNAFGFKYQKQAQALKKWRETDSIIVDAQNIVSRSRDEEIKSIVNILTSGQANNGDLLVLPIVGMGGLGKTTLAQLIYNNPDVQKHFQLKKWICISDEFDVCGIAKRICSKNDSGGMNLEESLQKLKEELGGKRYLLVLDDVWNEDANKWEKLKACFQHGGTGSVVLITTRKTQTAEIMGTFKMHDIAKLDDKFIKKIIERRAFRPGESKPADELVNLVDEVVKRCNGSPLAAKALGSMLHNRATVDEWNTVLQGSICNDETGILPILKLSYDDLPSGMKQCFAFCAVFPKDYEIDMDMLIKLWMANGFVAEQKGVNIETIGKRIFNELASRSFFQDMKEVTEDEKIYGYYSTTTCKIHDLMHDVAMSAMETDCVAITMESSTYSDFPNTARHLHFSCDGPKAETILDHSMKKTNPIIQTLLFPDYQAGHSLDDSSKFSSLRALQLRRGGGSFNMRAKHLHHLRYLDLSDSYIRTLPEDISILYNLQTLNLSGCYFLKWLPKHIKYMISLRHLYTHRCGELKCMPPELGRLTSLQTLTYFPVGIGSYCSNIRELRHLNLGGSLLLSQLENVGEEDAKAANLGDKKELRELSLNWESIKQDEESSEKDDESNQKNNEHCHKVLEGLKSPDGLQALRIYSYQGTTFPTWMGMMPNMVELYLYGCEQTKKLPPLCYLPKLQVLCLKGLEKLQCLCSGGVPFKFPSLKVLTLDELNHFEEWCEINWGYEEHIIFPLLEELIILSCGKMTALPKAPFPSLKVLQLKELCSFYRWQAVEATKERQITFPQLEELLVEKCEELIALPEAPFPSLKVLRLRDLRNFYRWQTVEATKERQITFPQLEELLVEGCEELIALPEAPFPSLKAVEATKKRQIRSQLLPHLELLSIWKCDSLVEVFNIPASPKKMTIWNCPNLKYIFGKQQGNPALTQGTSDEATASTAVLEPSSSAKGHFSACFVEEMEIGVCAGLSEVLNLPSSLRKIVFIRCSSLQFLSGQLDSLQVLEVRYCHGLTSLESCLGGLPLPALERLSLEACDALASLPNGPQAYASLRSLCIKRCPGIKSLPSSMQQRLDSIEWKILDVHLQAQGCPGIKSLPSSMQQRLDSIEVEFLDDHLQDTSPRELCPQLPVENEKGVKLLKPRTWKNCIR